MDVSGPRDVFPASAQSMPVLEVKSVIDKACEDGSWNQPCSESRTLAFYLASRHDEAEAIELWTYLMNKLAARSSPIAADRDATVTAEESPQDVNAGPAPAPPSLAGAVDVYGQTPIFYGAREGHVQLLRLMVETYKLDPLVQDGTKQSALYYACREGHDQVIRFLVSDCHVPIDHVDLNGDTALFYAARDNRESACKLMIEELGADSCFKNKYKKYASGIARMMGHRKLASYLEQARRTHQHHVDRGGGPSSGGGGGDSVSTKASDNEEKGDSSPPTAATAIAASGSVLAKPKRTLRSKRRSEVASDEEKTTGTRSSPKRRAKKTSSPTLCSQRTEESRDLCCLQYMSPLKSWAHTPQFKVEEFESLFPELAIWDSKSNPIRTLEADPYRTEWHRLATDVMRHLCNEVENAHFFREPVDTTKWNIPDYYDVVKEPIDFGTILTNLEVGVEYVTIKEFMRDLNRVFDNCILYNGPDSSIGKIAQKVREAALTYAGSIGLRELAEQERSSMEKSTTAAAAAAAAPPPPPPAAIAIT